VDEAASLAPRTILAVEALAEELAQVGSGRADALRAVLVRLAAALASLRSARSLRALGSEGSGESDPAIAFENAIAALSLIYSGARGRILDEGGGAPSMRFAAARALSSAIAKLASGATAPLDEEAIGELAQSLGEGLPGFFRALAADAARAVLRLPLDGSSLHPSARVELVRAELPAWIPLRRVLGGFFVERPLGAGAVGSVFVVTRVEDRNDAEAERFALKVPDFNENASRHLSEEQFLSLFRSEATALMSVPSHENLARFVTFDLAARPKPILVMELVEGPNLEDLVDGAKLEAKRAVRSLLEVLAGLEAMHGVGVGHLDLKPANVVLRKGEQAVLVDFGLAGRNLRPGCGSAPYAPPEVWTPTSFGDAVTPMAADVYSFACLAFEVLTGALLFQGETEMQLIAQHMAHDGLPPRLRAIAADPRTTALSELLFGAMRRNPRDRISTAELHRGFARLAPKLEAGTWPVVPVRA
jgi:predicted Ser/Thr protein kinase